MSTALAIAAVTAALRERLREVYNSPEVSAHVGGRVTVSAAAPATVTVGEDTRQVNLFLYQVAPNAGWSNRELPARNERGERVAAPPLALELGYLVTAYAQQDLEAESLLGYAMQAFHELPGLGRRGLREAAAGSTDVRVRQVLAESGLSEQEESIKLSLQPMGGEEMSKMWTAFQAQYRPSVAYHASVVLIRSQRPTVSPLPVLDPRLHVRTLRRPRIDAVTPQIVTAGDTLTLTGSGLRADTVRILFGDVASPAPLMVSDQRIDATVPAGLRAGVNTVRVDQPIDVSAGGPPDFRRGPDSNAVAFMLAPRIVDPVPASAVRGSVLALTVDPLVERRQRAELLLGSTAIAREAPEGEAEATATLRFEIPAAFAVGPHLLRIRVDGAESPLDLDGEGRYAGPQLMVTAA